MQKLRLTRRRRLNQFGSAFDRTDPQGLSPLSSLSFSPSAFHSRIAGMDHPGGVRRRTPAPDAGCVDRTRWLHRAAIRVRTPQERLPRHRRLAARHPEATLFEHRGPRKRPLPLPGVCPGRPHSCFSGPVLQMGSKLEITLVNTRITSSSFTSNRTSTSRCIRLYGSSA